jgi:uncharacterized RDD family membrane protein YckC
MNNEERPEAGGPEEAGGTIDPPPPGDMDSGTFPWPPGKADPTKRIVAVIIDAVLAVIVGIIPWVGGLVSAAYWVVRDGLELEFMDNRSVGKKLMKLRPVTADGRRPDMMASIKRNWMFGIGGIIWILMYIPLIGWLLIIPVSLIALAIGIIEIVKVLTDEEGRRFGDVWADTKVIEVDS